MREIQHPHLTNGSPYQLWGRSAIVQTSAPMARAIAAVSVQAFRADEKLCPPAGRTDLPD
jgi:hypothetical protein